MIYLLKNYGDYVHNMSRNAVYMSERALYKIIKLVLTVFSWYIAV